MSSTGDNYWQGDVGTGAGMVRCVIYIYAGAVERELSDPKSKLSKHEKSIGYKNSGEQLEKLLAEFCAKDAASLFTHQAAYINPIPMIKVDGAPENQQEVERISESCAAWVWRIYE